MEGIKNSQKLLLAASGAAIAVAGMGMIAAQPAQAEGIPMVTPTDQTITVGQTKSYTVTVKGNKSGATLAGVPVTWQWENIGHKTVQEAKITNKGAVKINKNFMQYTTKTGSQGKSTVKIKGLSNGVSKVTAYVTYNGVEESFVAYVHVNGVKKGTTVTQGKNAKKAQYKVTSSKYVAYKKAKVAKKATKATVVNSTKIKGATYTLNRIAANAFKGTNVKTVTVKSTHLTKANVKNSLKGSKVTTVKVPKAQYKKYKKYFTKANAGKKVTVVKA